jgi:hypothetical protein
MAKSWGYSRDCIAFLGARDRELFPDAKRKSKGLSALISVLRQCKYPLNILTIAILRVL